MALTSSGQLSVSTIHGHLLSNSSYAYEGGYALRAMSLHGRWKLNNPIFDMEDRISDFYGRDFSTERSTRSIGMVNGGYGGQFATIEEVCTGTQATTIIYISAYDYFTNYLNGNPTTFFSDWELRYRIATTKLWDTSRDWIWETDGVGIGTRINTDCTPYQQIPTNKYYGDDRCNRGASYIVESACTLVTGRYYQVCSDFNCRTTFDAPCEIYITGVAPSNFNSQLEVTNCFTVGCFQTICGDGEDPENPFIKK
jgi:hypothetical protein